MTVSMNCTVFASERFDWPLRTIRSRAALREEIELVAATLGRGARE